MGTDTSVPHHGYPSKCEASRITSSIPVNRLIPRRTYYEHLQYAVRKFLEWRALQEPNSRQGDAQEVYASYLP